MDKLASYNTLLFTCEYIHCKSRMRGRLAAATRRPQEMVTFFLQAISIRMEHTRHVHEMSIELLENAETALLLGVHICGRRNGT